LPSFEISDSILDSQVILELPELLYEPFVGLHAWAFQADKHEAVLEGGLVFVHEIGYKKCGRARDSCCAVDENVAAFSFVLDETNDWKESVTHLFVFAVS
jgi:hypothetical protein